MVSAYGFATANRRLLLALVASAGFFGQASGASLSWVDNTNGMAFTRIERREANAAKFAVIGEVAPGVSEYVDDLINSGEAYCYRLPAYTVEGTSPYSDESCTDGAGEVTTPPPQTELGVSFINPTDG